MNGWKVEIERLRDENERLNKIADEALADGYACGRIYGLPIFEGGCGKKVLKHESYRCADCMASFHRDCIRKHFKSHENQDDVARLHKEANINMQEICRLREKIAKIRALIIKKVVKE